jgi:type IV pilus assembly protein PilX
MTAASCSSPPQRGAVLVVALCLMLAVLMIGVSAARSALDAAKSARHERDRHTAFGAAQAALADAERDIEGGAGPASPRTALFAPGSSTGFVAGCGAAGDNLGLCALAAPPAAPAWQSAGLAHDGGVGVAYGSFTGAVMPTGTGLLPARLPRYLVELVPIPGSAPPAGRVYRVTAIGFGSNDATRVVVQAYYHKPLPALPGAPAAVAGLPAGRISWREIANWDALHRATLE